MSFISDLSSLLDNNEGLCIATIVASTLVALILGCVYMSLRNTTIMVEKGYVEVPHQSITGTHWEKAK